MDSIIWLAFVIPVGGAIFMLTNFKRKMAWWEYLTLFLAPLACMAAAYIISVRARTTDTEYWNSYLTKAAYYEAWETWDDETCYREVCTGSGDSRSCHTESYDCSSCERHSAYWEAYDNIGKSYRITRAHYDELCRDWGNRSFRDMRRSINHSGLCGKDGDAYDTKFPGDFDLIQPVCVQHRYENRVQCSKSVFNFEPVDSADSARYGLFRYPNYEAMGIFNYNPMQGWAGREAVDRLRRWNAKLGSMKQVHMMVLVFVGKPVDAAIHQERLWGRGNKNEFTLCIGVNNQKEIDWAYVISWTDEEMLKQGLANKVMEMPLDMPAIVDTMAMRVRSQYRRKEFADFSYIKVRPSARAVAWTFVITLVVTVGICIFSAMNRFDLDDPSGRGGRLRGRFYR